MEYDLLIRNGVVIDGSGAPRFRAHVAVSDGKIAALIPPDSAGAVQARESIDAAGLIVAPGFIDIHSHSDWVVPLAEHGAILRPFLLQGVTTFVGGNCGFSIAPIDPDRSRLLDESGQMLSERKFEWRWREVGELGAELKRTGLALNVAHLAGHGSIRLCVMGLETGDPSADQMRTMRAMVERAMADGAVGLSTGLGYFPGMIAKPAELATLAEVAGAAGGVLTSHLRAYSVRSLFFESREVAHNLLAVREMVEVARRARAPLQISHLIFVGRRTWSTAAETLREIDRAADAGTDVAFDTFPYTGGNTTIRIMFPAWAQDNLMALLTSAEGMRRLRESFKSVAPFIAEHGQLMWAVAPQLREFEGRFFGEIARMMNVDPIEAYLTIARESGGRGRVMMHLYSGDDEDEQALRAAMRHPLNLFEMDTILTSHGHHNPASFGTYPKLMGRYVRELGLLTLEQAVHKCAGMAAARMRLAGRGLIRSGYAADLTIFDPATIECTADFQSPNVAPTGIEYVMVNGAAVVRKGKWCGDGVMAGRWLTRAAP